MASSRDAQRLASPSKVPTGPRAHSRANGSTSHASSSTSADSRVWSAPSAAAETFMLGSRSTAKPASNGAQRDPAHAKRSTDLQPPSDPRGLPARPAASSAASTSNGRGSSSSRDPRYNNSLLASSRSTPHASSSRLSASTSKRPYDNPLPASAQLEVKTKTSPVLPIKIAFGGTGKLPLVNKSVVPVPPTERPPTPPAPPPPKQPEAEQPSATRPTNEPVPASFVPIPALTLDPNDIAAPHKKRNFLALYDPLLDPKPIKQSATAIYRFNGAGLPPGPVLDPRSRSAPRDHKKGRRNVTLYRPVSYAVRAIHTGIV